MVGWLTIPDLVNQLCDHSRDATCRIVVQQCVAASIVGVRLGLTQHISQSRAALTVELDEDDRGRLENVMRRGKDMLSIVGDCGDEYR